MYIIYRLIKIKFYISHYLRKFNYQHKDTGKQSLPKINIIVSDLVLYYITIVSFTFSMSLSVAGDTSECLLSSGDRGGAKPDPSDPFPDPALPEFLPIFTSECRRCSVSAMGTSNKLSVEFCVITGCKIDVLCCFRRQILQHHVFCEE